MTTSLTLGAGAGGHSWPLGDLPDLDAVHWGALHGIPTALVTGTNGKTTVVRLLAACAKAAGRTTGYCCTDGVFVAGHALGTGDYSGPAGARRVLRDARVEAAVLETARGGILRRGLAVARADVAVITSIAADHFGEFGVHDLEALAEVKLAVARALGTAGLLVVNADDALLARKAAAAGKPLGWFALDADHPLLAVHRQTGGATGRRARRPARACHCTAREHDLGAIEAMPLAAGGHSHFNVANLATAALGAAGSRRRARDDRRACSRASAPIPKTTPGGSCATNSGGLNLIVDFAHNPAALAGLVDFAQHLRGGRPTGAPARSGRQSRGRGHRPARRRRGRGAARPRRASRNSEATCVAATAAKSRRSCAARWHVRGCRGARRSRTPATKIGAVRQALAWARAGDVLRAAAALQARARATRSP